MIQTSYNSPFVRYMVNDTVFPFSLYVFFLLCFLFFNCKKTVTRNKHMSDHGSTCNKKSYSDVQIADAIKFVVRYVTEGIKKEK